MASQLIREMDLFQIQSDMGGLESDVLADFSFFLGDLNYRLNTTFDQLNNNTVWDAAIPMA